MRASTSSAPAIARVRSDALLSASSARRPVSTSSPPQSYDGIFRAAQALVHVLRHLKHVRVRLGGGLAVLGLQPLEARLQRGDLPLQKKYPAPGDSEGAALPQKKI